MKHLRGTETASWSYRANPHEAAAQEMPFNPIRAMIRSGRYQRQNRSYLRNSLQTDPHQIVFHGTATTFAERIMETGFETAYPKAEKIYGWHSVVALEALRDARTLANHRMDPDEGRILRVSLMHPEPDDSGQLRWQWDPVSTQQSDITVFTPDDFKTYVRSRQLIGIHDFDSRSPEDF